MIGTQIVRCLVCGKPYEFYSHYAGDQSACPKCRVEARKAMVKRIEVGEGQG